MAITFWTCRWSERRLRLEQGLRDQTCLASSGTDLAAVELQQTRISGMTRLAIHWGISRTALTLLVCRSAPEPQKIKAPPK
jgi:hypothetical protein